MGFVDTLPLIMESMSHFFKIAALRMGDGTEFIIDSIEFDVEIPEYIFSKASLRK